MGAEVGEEVADPLLALGDVVLADVEEGRLVLVGVERVVEVVELVGVDAAVDLAGAQAAGVDADDVEAVGHVAGQGGGHVGGEVGGRAAGPPGLTNRAPMRSPLAGTRLMLRVSVSPSGAS